MFCNMDYWKLIQMPPADFEDLNNHVCQIQSDDREKMERQAANQAAAKQKIKRKR